VNLSNWRQSELLNKTSWDNIFFNTYKVKWGAHKWISVPVDDKWKDLILVSTNSYRPTYNIDYSQLCKTYGKNVKFIALDPNEYNLFKRKYNVDAYTPSSIYELCVAINSCKLFIGNFSAPLAFAYAMHKKTVVGISDNSDAIHQLGLYKVIPNINQISDKNGTTEKINQLCFSEA
jgi:hypothetical protein